MPFYEFKCSDHGIYEFLQPLVGNHRANCPNCDKLMQRRFSVPNMRVAHPITYLQDLGDGTYEELDWKPDSEITPPLGQPYKTAKEVEMEQ